MGWVDKKIKRLMSLPRPLLFLHVFAKFLCGVGIGLIIANYMTAGFITYGVLLVIIAVIISLPSAYRVLKK